MQTWRPAVDGRSPADTVSYVVAIPAIARALDWVEAHADACATETVAIAQIPAPTFDEGRRSEYVAGRLESLGAAEIVRFGSGNVAGRFGSAGGPGIGLLAHLDTVFAGEQDHTVTLRDGRLYGIGVGDNSAGLGGILTLAAAAQAVGLQFARPVWLVADVAEEGLGDLRGARETMHQFAGKFASVIAIEGTMLGRLGHIAVGSRRWRVRFAAPGGHSWLDYGKPSAVHCAVSAAAAITRLPVPQEPRTTLNIGRISGGDGVNVLASRAELLLDLRSIGAGALEALCTGVLRVLDDTTLGSGCAYTVEDVGFRPAGALPRTHPLVALSAAVLTRVGITPEPTAGSTDANVPLSLNIPAVALGITHGGGIHSADEWIEPAPMRQGVQQLVLLCAALAGVVDP